MTGILLTKTSTIIIGPVATLLGYLMNGIFTLLEKIGMPSIGMAIIIFTIVIYLCMMPLTIKQQKFSKLSAKMNPELQAMRKKYEGKKDNDSMLKMNEETKIIYKKYGVSPSGSCLQLAIQMPILFALYRVIYNFPAYVPNVKAVYTSLVNKMIMIDGASDVLQKLKAASTFKKQFTNDAFVAGSEYMKNTFIDVLNKASSAEWDSLKVSFSSISTDIQNTYNTISHYNNFLGLNIGNSPTYIIKDAYQAGNYLLLIGALMIPLLSALTQFINVKLMPQAANNVSTGNEQADAMASSMKTMNMMMPIMSAVFCLTLPIGMGIYWITGAVVRSIQQIAINRHIDKIDFDEMIKKNIEKEEEKRKKHAVDSKLVNNAARLSTKNLNYSSSLSQKEKEEIIEKAKAASAKPGSIASKVNVVKEFNEKNISK